MKTTRKGRKAEAANKAASSHFITLHQRLYQSLTLGFRYSDNKEREWYTNDVEMQRLVIRSMSAYLADITPETLHIPFVKDSVGDMVKAIGGILRSTNDNVLTMASELVVRLISILPYSLLQPHVDHLSLPLSSLLSSPQSQAAIMSTTALNLILSKLGFKKENKMWQILGKHSVVSQLIYNMKTYSDKVKPIEYFVEMASLLSSIMQIWPHTRYLVWTDDKFREVVELLCHKPEISVKVAVLQLYSAIALCGFGAQKLMESGEISVKTIVHCMGKPQPLSLRLLAFKAAQRLMVCEDLCLKVLSISCKPVMVSIISAMNYSSTHHGKVCDEDVCLMLEACRLALVTRWPGKHHGYLWKLGISKSLVNILMFNLLNVHPHCQSWSAEELISVVREGLNANFLLDLRSYLWEIIGSLAAHCEEDINRNKDGNEFYIRVLIAGACISFMDSIGKERLLCRANRTYMLRCVSAGKAVLMMMYSPCEYIEFHTKLILSEILRIEGGEQLRHLLKDFHFLNSGGISMPDELQTLISLMGLTCYSGLPDFSRCYVKNDVVKALLGFVRWWFRNEAHIDSVSTSSHLKDTINVRVCCIVDMDDWEGREIHLLLALWGLAELINIHAAKDSPIDIFVGQTNYGKELFMHDIQNICSRTSSSGLRWYSSYLLSLYGIYGFPTKLGKKVSSLLCEEDYSDMYLVLRNGQYISVHKVVLLIRCPSFLPPDDPVTKETPDRHIEDQVRDDTHKTKTEVTLSAHVDEQALLKILEYVYSGCLHVEEELVRKVKVLAKHCNVQTLLRLLCKNRPQWATSLPSFDLTTALGPSGRKFSDVFLEAKSGDDTGWTSNCCSHSVPHIHCHKAILMSSCNYVRALFQSGMQESRSQSLRVPVSWESLNKWVIWVYLGDIPKPVSGCLWDNMETEKKMHELQPYIELCWLAEFWFIDELQEGCSEVVASFLDSPELSLKLIQFAADLSQWEIVNVAANKIAPVYGNLRVSGALDLLDEELVEIIRLASVRLSQE